MTEWRPFEQSRENVAGAKAVKNENTCNRHVDCRAAHDKYIELHRKIPPANFHCHDECCEECFGS